MQPKDNSEDAEDEMAEDKVSALQESEGARLAAELFAQSLSPVKSPAKSPVKSQKRPISVPDSPVLIPFKRRDGLRNVKRCSLIFVRIK